jgi:hypothetical protein
MDFLGRFRFRTKRFGVLAGSLIAAVIAILIGAATIRSRAVSERAASLEALVHAALSTAQALHHDVEAHNLSPELAFARLADWTRTMRFGAAQGYLAVLEPGVSSNATTPGRRSLRQNIEAALHGRDSALLKRGFALPGAADPKSGIAYAAWFRPWSILVVASAGTDDLSYGFPSGPALLRDAIVLTAMIAALLVGRKLRPAVSRRGPDPAIAAPPPPRVAMGPPVARTPAEAEPAQRPAIPDDQLAPDGGEIITSTAKLSPHSQGLARPVPDPDRRNERAATRTKNLALTTAQLFAALRQTRGSILYTRPMPRDLHGKPVPGDVEQSAMQIRQLIKALDAADRTDRPAQSEPAAAADASVEEAGSARAGLVQMTDFDGAHHSSVAQPGGPAERLRAASANPACDPSLILPGSASLTSAASPPALTNASAARPTLASFGRSSWPRRDAPPLVCQAVPSENDWQEF